MTTDDRERSATSIWVESVGLNLQEALDLMEAAVRDCPDELWRTNMWAVPGPDAGAEVRGPDGALITDPVERRALVQRHGAPWGVAWHALQILDARLHQGGLVPWEASPALGVEPGFDITALAAPWSQADLLAYLAYCRERIVDALKELSDERATARLSTGRHQGKPYAWRLMQMLRHVTEHASQIRQFITAAGVTTDA
jgi:hypothetical protein